MKEQEEGPLLHTTIKIGRVGDDMIQPRVMQQDKEIFAMDIPRTDAINLAASIEEVCRTQWRKQ